MTAITFDPGSALRWLHGVDPNSSRDSPGTVAEHFGIDKAWPGQGTDSRDAALVELADAAIDVDIIQLPAGVDDLEMIMVVDKHMVYIGFRIAITDVTGRTVIGPTLNADDLIDDDATGLEAAITALANVADHVHETLAQLAPLPWRTADGHSYAAWTDGHATGFQFTSPSGRRQLVYLNPSHSSSDGIATVTVYHGAAGEPADQHEALSHIDLLTIPCPGCTRPIADTAIDCQTCRSRPRTVPSSTWAAGSQATDTVNDRP